MKTLYLNPTTKSGSIQLPLFEELEETKFPSNYILKPLEFALNELEKEFEVENNPSYSQLVNYSSTRDIPIHRWFKYREGYSVNLIENIIDSSFRLNKMSSARVLDPFCGCGTTLLGSKKKRTPAIGIDINPISVFVSRVKIENYTPNDLEQIGNWAGDIINRNTKKEYDLPNLSILEKAFHPGILGEIMVLKKKILEVQNSKIRDFLFLGWLSILEPLSNTYKEGNGLKYRFIKRTKSGYMKIPLQEWYEKQLPDDKHQYVKEAFKQRIKLMLNDIRSEKLPRVVAKVIRGDSRRISEIIYERDISLCIFSPPYCNCFDYFEIFKLELWLGDFIKSYQEMKKERKKSLRSNANTDLNQDYYKLDYLEKFIQLINMDELWNKKVTRLIRGYFSDMKDVLSEIFKVLAKDGRCFIIVGNSAYGGVLIPTDILLSKISKEIGFKVNRIYVARHLTTSSQQKKALYPLKRYLRESVVCLQK